MDFLFLFYCIRYDINMKDCILKMNVHTKEENIVMQMPIQFAKHFNVRPILFALKKNLATYIQNFFSILDETTLGLCIEVENADVKIILEVIEYVH